MTRYPIGVDVLAEPARLRPPPPPPPPGRERRPIYYRPIERHWYRLLDIVVPIWRAYARTPFGRFTIWLTLGLARLVWLAARVLGPIMLKVVGLAIIVGFGLFFTIFFTAFNGPRRR